MVSRQLLAFVDDEQIAVSMLSLTAPGIEGWKGADRIDIARRVHEYGAELVANHPGRPGYFATLALPDIDAGLAEIRRRIRPAQLRCGNAYCPHDLRYAHAADIVANAPTGSPA